MDFETKILSLGIQELLYEQDTTVGTAESCTGGRVGEAIIAVPGASQYFKGGIIAYANEVKEQLLHVSHDVIVEQSAVSEEVARQMVAGACKALQTTYAIAVTGTAGPGGGTPEVPVGTIWIGYGTPEDIRTHRITEDNGRDLNLAIATNTALRLFLEYLKETQPTQQTE